MRAAMLCVAVSLVLATAAAAQTRGLPASRSPAPPAPLPPGSRPPAMLPGAERPGTAPRGAAPGTLTRDDGRSAAPPRSPGTGPAAPTSPPNDLPIFYTRERRFTLPISVYNAPFRIVAVQLHVSADRGKTWRTYAQQPVESKQFVFETPVDGEFWFASKTVDDRNAVRPGGPTRAEQRVVVDAESPELEFSAAVGTQGEIRCTWKTRDPTLDPRTFKIEYQAAINEPWQMLEIPESELVAQQGVLAGQWEWRPEKPARAMHVRLEVSDRAGNRAADTQRVFLPRVAGTNPENPSTGNSSAGNPAEPDALAGAQELSPDTQSASIPWPRNNRVPEQLAVTSPATQAWVASTRRAPNDDRRRAADDPPVSESAATSAPEPLGRLASSATAPLESAPAGVRGQVRPSVTDRVTAPEGLGAGPDRALPAAGASSAHSGTNSGNIAAPSSSTAWPQIPAGEIVRVTSARRFQLDYDIESAGPLGVLDIELWATEDGGRTWSKWGSDGDKKSPFEVEVEQEGLYGFRIVVIAANGLASDPPYGGSPADLWVGVDNTPPSAEITAVVYGTGARVGELDIRWQCADQKLLDRPITLSFSEAESGPWTTIATGLPNTGQYYWPVDASVPRQVYLRMQVADEAGNVADFTIREPINTEKLIPKGRIRSLTPVP